MSEAFGGTPAAGAVSSYVIEPNGDLAEVSQSVNLDETATCWVVLDPDGRVAYASNTASSTVSALEITFDGQLLALGVVDQGGNLPTDLAISNDGEFLYVLNSGPMGGAGHVAGYQIEADASLTELPTLLIDPLVNFATGLAAR